jgi:ATP-dependent protease Clp ATPase subunit
MSYVHAILGPTGVGKTALATRLARETSAPTVVADRIQCYRDLAEHGREQEEIFSSIFESTPVSSLRELNFRS